MNQGLIILYEPRFIYVKQSFSKISKYGDMKYSNRLWDGVKSEWILYSEFQKIKIVYQKMIK